MKNRMQDRTGFAVGTEGAFVRRRRLGTRSNLQHKCEPRHDLLFVTGSSGAGTHLLTRLLAQDPSIFIGPELDVYNQQEIFSRGLVGRISLVIRSTRTWAHLVGVLRKLNLVGSAYATGRSRTAFSARKHYDATLLDVMRVSLGRTGARCFYESLVRRALKRSAGHSAENRLIVVEKTLSAVFGLARRMDLEFADAKVIAVVRDGRDSIVSDRAKSLGTVRAAFSWLCRTSAIADLHSKHPDRVRVIRYEDLVTDTDHQMAAVWEFLGLAPTNLLTPEDTFLRAFDSSFHGEWSFRPDDPVTAAAVGRWRKFPCDHEGLRALVALSPTDRALDRFGCEILPASSLLEKFGYEDANLPRKPPTLKIPGNLKSLCSWIS